MISLEPVIIYFASHWLVNAAPSYNGTTTSGHFQHEHKYDADIDKDLGHRHDHKKLGNLLEEFLGAGDYVTIPANSDEIEKPIDITMIMSVESLLHLDMRSQTYLVTALFQVEWYDRRLTWDTKVYPYQELLVKGNEVWRPVLVIGNSLGAKDTLWESEIPMELHPDGLVRWWPGETFELDCNIDIKYYPFDVQRCKVRAMQWVGSVMEFNCTEASVVLNTKGNGQWDIVDSYTVNRRAPRKFAKDSQFWFVDFRLVLRRRWTFYAMNMLFPVFLVSGLNCVVFLLPVECGEKMSVSVTTFLTLAVYMTLVQEDIPNNSDSICYLVVYLIAQMSFGALAIVLSALQVECHHVDLVEGGEWDKTEEAARLATFETEINNDQTPTDSPNKGPAVPRRRTFLRRCTHIVAEMDFYCFPIFLALNIISFLSYCIVIVRGPLSEY